MVTHADGRETSLREATDVGWRLQELRRWAEEAGRDPASIETHLHHNINVNEDRQAALDEPKRFLDTYSSMESSPRFVEAWTAPARLIDAARCALSG